MPLKICMGALGALLFLCAASAAQSTVDGASAKDLVKIALEKNQYYLSARERVTEAQALVRHAGIRPSPTVEVETGTGALLGSRGESEYSAAYLQPIETGGKRDKRVAVAEKGVALAEAEVKERERQLRFEINDRFTRAVLEELKLSMLRSTMPAAQEGLGLTQRRVALGDAAPLEEQLLAAEIKRIESQLALLDSSREAALTELLLVVGVKDEEAPSLILELGTSKALNLPALQELALRQRSDLTILKLLEEQAGSEADLARAEARPDITASIRYTHSRSAFDQFGFSENGAITPLKDTDNVVTVGVSIPLSNRKRAGASIDAANSRSTQQRLRLEHLQKAIPQEVAAAFKRWTGATRSMEILMTGVIEPSRKSLTVIEEAYRLGQFRLLDVLNERRRLFDLQLSYIEAQAEAARALNELERATGRRTAMKTTLFVTLVFFATVSCSRPAETTEEKAVEQPTVESKVIQMTEEAQKHVGLQVVNAGTRELSEYLQAIGTIKPIDNKVAHIRALTGGRLTNVAVKLGDRVEANHILATYDNLEAGDIVSQLQTAQSELERINVQLAVAKLQTERNRQLAEIGAIPRKEYELNLGEEKSLNASIAVQQSVVTGLTTKLNRLGLTGDSPSTSIRSPFSGVVIAASAAPGEAITPETELFSIADLSQVWVQAEVYEKDLGRIQVGRTASIRVDTYADREFNGQVTYVSDLLDPQTRTAKVRCDVANPDGRLKIDMFATVLLPTTFSKKALAIPSEAIQQISGRNVAFVRTGATTFEQRSLEVGRTVQGMAEVLAGLQNGDSVVTKGAFHLKSIVLGEQIGEEE